MNKKNKPQKPRCRTTHHLACDCREMYFAELENDLEIAIDALEKIAKVQLTKEEQYELENDLEIAIDALEKIAKVQLTKEEQYCWRLHWASTIAHQTLTKLRGEHG